MIRVIIVDDHPVVRRGLKEIIAVEQDMQVVGEAENAQEAIRVIRRTVCDAVVLDITLPDGSGLDVLGRLKSERPTLPVLIMSIHDEELYALRVLKTGASGYLMKNSIPEELVKAIRKIASGGKYISLSLAERLASEPADQNTPKDGKQLPRPHPGENENERQRGSDPLCPRTSARMKNINRHRPGAK
jgi:two-component system invasion response regulator UvrY